MAMKYLASAECHIDAHAGVQFVQQVADPVIEKMIAGSGLSGLDGTLIYVPIIMPNDMLDKYKERSRYTKKTNTYSCCPQLDYDTFLRRKYELQIREYLRGLALAVPFLHRIGATKEQEEEFNFLLMTAVALGAN